MAQRTEYKVLNTYRGFTIKPTLGSSIQTVMRKVVTALDTMLGLLVLTRQRRADGLAQKIHRLDDPILQYKKAASRPSDRRRARHRQVSLFGENLMTAPVRQLSVRNRHAAALLTDNAFLITPFIGKLITFVDEVRLETATAAINEIKKIIRQKRISGQLKFKDQQGSRNFTVD